MKPRPQHVNDACAVLRNVAREAGSHVVGSAEDGRDAFFQFEAALGGDEPASLGDETACTGGTPPDHDRPAPRKPASHAERAARPPGAPTDKPDTVAAAPPTHSLGAEGDGSRQARRPTTAAHLRPRPQAHAHRGRLLLTREGACASRDRQARDLRAIAHVRCRRPHTMNGQAASAMPDQHGGRAHRPATLRHAARASHDTPHPPREVGGPTPLRRRRRPRSEPPTRAGSHGARAQAE